MSAAIPPTALRWFRWRECWAWGYGDWQFVEMKVATEKEALETLCEDHSNDWSDKWRGIQVEEILLPPRKVLEDGIAGSRARAEALLERARRWELLLAETT